MPNINNATLGVKLDLSQAERQIRQFESRAINLNFGNTRPLGRLTGDVAEFEKSMSAANARVIAFGAAAAIIGSVGTALHAMVSESIAVEKALTNINTTLGTSASQLSKFGDSLFGIAKNTESAFADVAKAAEEFSHQSLNVSEVLRRTSDAMTLVRTSGLPVIEVVKSLTTTVNAFNQEALNTTQVADRLTAVSTRFGVGIRDLTEAFAGVGNSAQQVKVPFNELIGLITRVQQVSGKGGEEIGEALRTIFTRVNQTDTLKGLNDIGVAVKTVSGNTLPAIEILSNLARTMDRLGDSQREQVAELLGGVRQVAILKTALGDLNSQYSVYRNVVDAANNSTGEAARRQSELNKTISAQANEALNNLKKLAAGAGTLVFGPVIKNVLGAVNAGGDALEGDSIGKKIGEGILRGIGNVLAGPGLVAGGVLAAKLLKSFGDFALKAAGNVLEIGRASEKELQIQTGINAILQQTPGLYQTILANARSVTEQEELTLTVLREQQEAQAARQAFVGGVSSGLASRGVRFSKEKGAFSGLAEAEEAEEVLAGGYVPNIVNSASRYAEISEAARQGYSVQPSQVRSMVTKIDGKTSNVVYNTRERVIQNFANTGEPAIIPPGKSLSDLIRDKINSAEGFVPNLRDSTRSVEEIENLYSDLTSTIRKNRRDGGPKKGIRKASTQLEQLQNLSPEEQSEYIVRQLVEAQVPKDEIITELRKRKLPVGAIPTSLRESEEFDLLSSYSSYRQLSAGTILEGAVRRELPVDEIVENRSTPGYDLRKTRGDAYDADIKLNVPGSTDAKTRFLKQTARYLHEEGELKQGDYENIRLLDNPSQIGDYVKGLNNSRLSKLFKGNAVISRQEQALSASKASSVNIVGHSSLSQTEIFNLFEDSLQKVMRQKFPDQAEFTLADKVGFLKERAEGASRGESLNLRSVMRNAITEARPLAVANNARFASSGLNFLAEGHIPNLANIITPEKLRLARKMAKRIYDFPIEERQEAINSLLGNSLRLGVPNSGLRAGAGAATASRGVPVPRPDLNAGDLSLRFDVPGQVGAILAPRAYREAVNQYNVKNSGEGVGIIDKTTPIDVLGVKAFPKDTLYADPVRSAREGSAVPFRSQEDIERYLVQSVSDEGFSRLAQRLQTIAKPSGRGALKEGFELRVNSRNVPIIDIEKTNLAGAYRAGVQKYGLSDIHDNASFGKIVNDVVTDAVNNKIGQVRNPNASLELPSIDSDFIENILGIRLGGYAPVGLDAKSSIDKYGNVERSLLKKGNRSEAGLGVFENKLEQAMAQKGLSLEEQSIMSRLLKQSSRLFLKGKGYVPNLVKQVTGDEALTSGMAESVPGLKESIAREIKNTGISTSQVRVNFTDKKGVPGVSVTNTRDEGPRADPEIGFDRVRKQGGNIFAAGSGNEFGSGWIPNLVLTNGDKERIAKDIERLKKQGKITSPEQEAQYRKFAYQETGSKTTTERVSDDVERTRARSIETTGANLTAEEEQFARNNARRNLNRELNESGLNAAQARQDQLAPIRRAQSESNLSQFVAAEDTGAALTTSRYNAKGERIQTLSEEGAARVRNNVNSTRALSDESRLGNNRLARRAESVRRAAVERGVGEEGTYTQLGAAGFRENLGVIEGPSPRSRNRGRSSGSNALEETVGELTNAIGGNNAGRPSGGAGGEKPNPHGAFGGKLQTAGIALSIGAPLVAGLIASGLSDPRSQRKVEGIGGAIGTGASLAAFGGAPGAVAGVAVAGFGIIKTIAENAKASFEDLTKETQDLAAKKKEEIDSISGVLKARSSLDEAGKSGASASQISVLTSQYSAALNGVGDSQTRARLLNAKDDTERTQIYTEHEEQASREISAKQAVASSAGIEEQFKGGLFKKSASIFGYQLGSDSQDVNDKSIAAVRNLASQTAQAGPEGLKQLDEIRSRLSPELNEIFTSFFNQMTNTNKVVSDAVKVQGQYQAAVAGLNNTIARLSAERLFTQGVQYAKEDGNYSVKLNRLRNTTDLARPYLSDAAQAQIGLDTGNLENERSYSVKLREVQEKYNSAFQEGVNDPTIKDQPKLQALQKEVIENGGNADGSHFDRLIALQQQGNEASNKINETLNNIKLESVKATEEFKAQKEILRDNFINARRQAYANSLNSFLGTGSLTNADRTNSQAAAGAEANILSRGLDETRNHTFQVNYANAYGVRGYGGRGQVLADRFRQTDPDKIAIAQDVKDQVSQGLLPTLAATGYANFSDLPSQDRKLVNESRQSLESGLAANKYEDLENRANDRINPFLGKAGIYSPQLKGTISEALQSRDVGKVNNAITAVQNFQPAETNVEQRGAQGIVVRELQQFSRNLQKVPAAAREQSARILQGDVVPLAIRQQTSEIKSDTDRQLEKFNELIARSQVIAENTSLTNGSVIQLSQLLQQQGKAVNASQALNDKVKERTDVQKDRDAKQDKLNDNQTAQSKLFYAQGYRTNSKGEVVTANNRGNFNTDFENSLTKDLPELENLRKDHRVNSRPLDNLVNGLLQGNSREKVADDLVKRFQHQGSVAPSKEAILNALSKNEYTKNLSSGEDVVNLTKGVHEDDKKLATLDPQIEKLRGSFDAASKEVEDFGNKLKEAVNSTNAKQTAATNVVLAQDNVTKANEAQRTAQSVYNAATSSGNFDSPEAQAAQKGLDKANQEKSAADARLTTANTAQTNAGKPTGPTSPVVTPSGSVVQPPATPTAPVSVGAPSTALTPSQSGAGVRVAIPAFDPTGAYTEHSKTSGGVPLDIVHNGLDADDPLSQAYHGESRYDSGGGEYRKKLSQTDVLDDLGKDNGGAIDKLRGGVIDLYDEKNKGQLSPQEYQRVSNLRDAAVTEARNSGDKGQLDAVTKLIDTINSLKENVNPNDPKNPNAPAAGATTNNTVQVDLTVPVQGGAQGVTDDLKAYISQAIYVALQNYKPGVAQTPPSTASAPTAAA